MRCCWAVLALMVVLGGIAVPQARGDVLFYNGDFRDMDNLSCERNTNVTDSRVYENFHITGNQQITGLYGHFLQNDSMTISQAYYEIRQGIVPGNGGTLIAGGQISVTGTVVAQSGWGVPIYRIAGAPAGLVLGTGDYWMTLAPIGHGMGSGQWWILGSTGANAVGSPAFDGASYWDSTYWNQQWVRLPNPNKSEGNWSFGVTGTAVPEPSSLLALIGGLGSLSGIVLRRRSG